jgi:hypothetical protein
MLTPWQICLRCRWNRRQFNTGVVDTGGAPSLANIFGNFSKKFEMTLTFFFGACGKMKNLKRTISWHCPFNCLLQEDGKKGPANGSAGEGSSPGPYKKFDSLRDRNRFRVPATTWWMAGAILWGGGGRVLSHQKQETNFLSIPKPLH